jgi:hypothetical protein
MSPAPMPIRLPAEPPGSTREDLSPAFPVGKQMSFRLSAAYERTDNIAVLRSAFKRAVEAAGGVEWLAITIGKPISYASKISEALNGVEGRHIQFEEWTPALIGCWPAMEIILGTLCELSGRDKPKAKRVATDSERAAALIKVLEKAGPAGEALIKAAADEAGVDVEGFVR